MPDDDIVRLAHEVMALAEKAARPFPGYHYDTCPSGSEGGPCTCGRTAGIDAQAERTRHAKIAAPQLAQAVLRLTRERDAMREVEKLSRTVGDGVNACGCIPDPRCGCKLCRLAMALAKLDEERAHG